LSAAVRWAKFNAVGVLGMAVQLGVLAGTNRWWGGHYLIATGVAIEVTLLHNFFWHVRYTWRDRPAQGSRMAQMVRFQMANGVVSLVGNLVLMRVLVQEVRMGVVVANAVAILGCSVANFWLGDRWAFGVGDEMGEGRAECAWGG
jgi:putative flippase GtrA